MKFLNELAASYDRNFKFTALAADREQPISAVQTMDDILAGETAARGIQVRVLGAFAARHLGIDHVTDRLAVWLGGRWFVVVGILNPVTLAPEVDSAALVGWQVAASLLGFDGHPGTEYVRADPSAVAQVQALLAGAANPADPEQVQVSRPSDALAARAVANSAFTTLLLVRYGHP